MKEIKKRKHIRRNKKKIKKTVEKKGRNGDKNYNKERIVKITGSNKERGRNENWRKTKENNKKDKERKRKHKERKMNGERKSSNKRGKYIKQRT